MFFAKIFSSIFKLIKLPAFKIISINKENDKGLIYFWIKIVGKSSPLIRKDPIDLLKEIKSDRFFSQEDYYLIIDALLENQKIFTEKKLKKKYSIVKHQFSPEIDEPLIVFIDVNNKAFIKPAKEIYYDLEILKKFSPEDCACIGNIVGSHETEKNFRQLAPWKTKARDIESVIIHQPKK